MQRSMDNCRSQSEKYFMPGRSSLAGVWETHPDYGRQFNEI